MIDLASVLDGLAPSGAGIDLSAILGESSESAYPDPTPTYGLGAREARPWSSLDERARAHIWRVHRAANRHRDRVVAEREADIRRAANPGLKTFSTQYAVDLGKTRGWIKLDRERYDARLKRHHDLYFGADVLFNVPGKGLVLVQAAGRSEVAEHRRRFERWGGAEKCREFGFRFLYVVFERGNKTPLLEEWWA